MKKNFELLLENIHKKGIDLLLVTTPVNTYYLSGFLALIYTRPVIVVVSENPCLIIPELEFSHAKEKSWIDNIITYSDDELKGKEDKTPFDLAIDKVSQAIKHIRVAVP